MTKDKLFLIGLLALLFLFFRSEWQNHKLRVALSTEQRYAQIYIERDMAAWSDFEQVRDDRDSCYDKLTSIMAGFRAAQALAKLHALPPAPPEQK